MAETSQPVNLTPIDAASVVLMRDGPQGLEVFLARRHAKSESFGGAYVFPGGKLDLADSGDDFRAFLNQPSEELSHRLGEPGLSLAKAAGLFVAAMRETFEESGVLFAIPDPSPVKKRASTRNGSVLLDLLQSRKLTLDSRSLVPWTRWVTPVNSPAGGKRFDTRFFLAGLPDGATASHDSKETTQSVWLSPTKALREYWDGAMEMAPPQIMSLVELARFDRVSQALRTAALRVPPVILPSTAIEDGTLVMFYPGDPKHNVTEQAMPGPTRLVFRRPRFEPPEGFEAFFS